MSNRLFIGGLSWDTTTEGLKEAFSQFGTVTDAHIVTDRETGKSRGFGFITFASPADAEEAKKQMNGEHLDGRRIRVDEAEERQRRGGGGGGGNHQGRGGRGRGEHPPTEVDHRRGGRRRKGRRKGRDDQFDY